MNFSPTASTTASLAKYVGPSAAISAAPLLPSSLNSYGAGGVEVALIAEGISTLIQALKMHNWYKQNKYALWTCIVLALIICLILWHDDLVKAILNSFGAMSKAATQYGPLKELNMFGPGTDNQG